MTGRILVFGRFFLNQLRASTKRETNPLLFWFLVSIKFLVVGRILAYAIWQI